MKLKSGAEFREMEKRGIPYIWRMNEGLLFIIKWKAKQGSKLSENRMLSGWRAAQDDPFIWLNFRFRFRFPAPRFPLPSTALIRLPFVSRSRLAARFIFGGTFEAINTKPFIFCSFDVQVAVVVISIDAIVTLAAAHDERFVPVHSFSRGVASHRPVSSRGPHRQHEIAAVSAPLGASTRF